MGVKDCDFYDSRADEGTREALMRRDQEIQWPQRTQVDRNSWGVRGMKSATDQCLHAFYEEGMTEWDTERDGERKREGWN